MKGEDKEQLEVFICNYYNQQKQVNDLNSRLEQLGQESIRNQDKISSLNAKLLTKEIDLKQKDEEINQIKEEMNNNKSKYLSEKDEYLQRIEDMDKNISFLNERIIDTEVYN